MELTYMVRAVTRFWWVGLVCAGLIFAPVFALKGGAESSYYSEAVLLISPPSTSPFPNTGNNDRYIASQIGVLNSDLISEAAAVKLGVPDDAQAIARSVEIVASPATDVVTITANAPTAERAQEIGAAVVDSYFEQLQAQLDSVQGNELAALDQQVTDLQARLTEVDAQIEEVLEPFLPSGSIPDTGVYPPVPTADQVAPNLASARENLLAQYQQLMSTRTQLETAGQLRVTSQIVQPASLPSAPVTTSNTTLLGAALVGSLLIGVAAAVVAARLSPWAIDHQDFEELLGERPLGVFPYEKSLRKQRELSLKGVPRTAQPFVEMVCVRTETMVRSGGPISIAVLGSSRASGATTLAATMANEFEVSGSKVLLVDADPRTPELSNLFAAEVVGIAGLMDAADHDSLAFGSTWSRPPRLDGTAARGVQLVGIQSQSDVEYLRHEDLRKLVDAAKSGFGVIVIDGGPLLDTVTARNLVDTVDVVVLALPERYQTRADLPFIRDQFTAAGVRPLAVLMPVSRRSRSSKTAPRTVVSD
jgi:polysaccharide biosynthesis transport protein